MKRKIPTTTATTTTASEMATASKTTNMATITMGQRRRNDRLSSLKISFHRKFCTTTKTTTTTTKSIVLLLLILVLSCALVSAVVSEEPYQAQQSLLSSTLSTPTITDRRQQERRQQQEQRLECPLALFLPLLTISNTHDTQQQQQRQHYNDGLSLLATALIAMEDFNNRTSSVQSIQTVFGDDNNLSYQNCNIEFPLSNLKVVDTTTTTSSNIDTLDILSSVDTSSSSSFVSSLCGILGPIDNHVALQLAQQLQTLQQQNDLDNDDDNDSSNTYYTPPVVVWGNGDILSDGQTPLSSSSSSSSSSPSTVAFDTVVSSTFRWSSVVSQPILSYLNELHHVPGSVVGVLYAPNEYIDTDISLRMWDPIQHGYPDLIVRLGILSTVVDSENNNNNNDDTLFRKQVYERLQTMKMTQSSSSPIQTIVIAVYDPSLVEIIAQVADELGMLTDNQDEYVGMERDNNNNDDRYLWMIINSGFSSSFRQTSVGMSPSLTKLYRQSRIFDIIDGFYTPVSSSYNRDYKTSNTKQFLNDWPHRLINLSPHLTNIYQSMSLSGYQTSTSSSQQDSDSQQQQQDLLAELRRLGEDGPTPGSAYVYDSVFAMGMAACDRSSLLNADFVGASCQYNLQDRSLPLSSATFGVFTVQEVVESSSLQQQQPPIASSSSDTTITPIDENSTLGPNLTVYESVLIDTTINSLWVNVTATNHTTRSTEDQEAYRSLASSIIVIVAATMANLFAFGSGLFFFMYRKNRIVSVGQPPFLYMVCFGSMLIASSVYFTAADEGSGRTTEALSDSCVATTWFYYMGSVIFYMALFSKLWRIEKVSQFRRRQTILVHHVLGPMLVMMFAVISILIAYTIVDPPHWTREEIGDDPLTDETGSFGLCEATPAYAVAMDLLIIISIIIALVMSCRTREKLPEDITDARRVTQTLVAHFFIALLGFIFTIVAIAINSNLFIYISFVLVTILSSVFSVAFLSIPKMYYVYRHKRTGQLPEGLRRGGNVRVSGLVSPSVLNSSSQRFHPSSLSHSSGTERITASTRNVFSSSSLSFKRGTRPSSRSFDGSIRNTTMSSTGRDVSRLSSRSLNASAVDSTGSVTSTRTPERRQRDVSRRSFCDGEQLLPTSVADLMAAAAASTSKSSVDDIAPPNLQRAMSAPVDPTTRSNNDRDDEEHAETKDDGTLSPPEVKSTQSPLSPPIQISVHSEIDDMSSQHSATSEDHIHDPKYSYSSGDVL